MEINREGNYTKIKETNLKKKEKVNKNQQHGII